MDNKTSYQELDKLSRDIILCVLSENLDKLGILKDINGWSDSDQTLIEYKTIEEQCTSITKDKDDHLPAKSKEKVDLVDFQRDCSFIESTLRKTFEEIFATGRYQGLSQLGNISKKLQTDEAEFLEETKKKEIEFVKLQNMYYNQKETFRKEIDKVMRKIGIIKDEIEDFELEAEIKANYVTNWENAKIEMSKYVLLKSEKEKKETISRRQHDFTKEDRVHQEIMNIFNELEMDLQRDIRRWKVKYENDLQVIEAKICDLKDIKDEQQEKTIAMVTKFLKRQEKMDAYKVHKIQQEEKRKDSEKRERAATKIQSWWRGTMVRRGLGKYRKKKDKKGKKKTPEKHK